MDQNTRKHRFLEAFGIAVILLALVKCGVSGLGNEGNEADKKLGFKYLQSYPYDPPEFRIGDYVHWKYDHVKFSTWLMISLDTQHIYNTKGRIWMCNN